MRRYTIAIFLGSFLLFLVQPMLARYILPWYGGSPAVWTTCMLFFQAFLLVGYVYAHYAGEHLTARSHAVCHLVLLAVSLIRRTRPPDDGFQPAGAQSPTAGILFLLTFSVGLPYLLVSSSSPLLQKWRHITLPAQSPYRLFALSNLGSLLGLLVYPFVIEPMLSLVNQTRVWSIGYAGYVAICTWCVIPLLHGSPPPSSQEPDAQKTNPGRGMPVVSSDRYLWLALSACGSVALLATTNQMCQDVAVVPFLWILPLCLYLLSFTICFQHEGFYDRRFWVAAMVCTFGAVVALLKQKLDVELSLQIRIYSTALLTCCMICHGELVRSKPPPAYLTSFYLMVALGGAAGGIFVGLVAPNLFDDYWEFPLALAGTYLLAAICVLRDKSFLPVSWPSWLGPHLWAAGAWILLFFLGSTIYEGRSGMLEIDRNFHGVLRVYEGYKDTKDWRRYLWNGQISHGSQYLDESLRTTPTHYFGAGTGIAIAIENHPRRQGNLSMGVIGLGTGTLAAYGRDGDVIRFYEINPDVIRLSKKYFSYLEDSPAVVEIVAGDARGAYGDARERPKAAERPEGPGRCDGGVAGERHWS